MNIDLSIVIPAYNEKENIRPLYNKLKEALTNVSYEILFIDDGSNDGTFEELKKIQNAKVRVIRIDENRGQSWAIFTGWKASRGLVIVTMDADLQNDPKDIIPMIKKIKEGFDIVLGVRKKRKDNIFRLIQSKIASVLSNFVLHDKFKDRGCGIKCYRKEVVNHLEYFDGIHIYFPSLLRGCKTCEIEVKHFRRTRGFSKYRGFRGTINGIKYLLFIKSLLKK